jgi:exodeoxyribonuclease VII small subunit
MKSDKKDISKLDYETALKQLEEITSRLESEQLPLEQMMELYTRGQELADQCNRLLDEAELHVKTISTASQPADEDE